MPYWSTYAEPADASGTSSGGHRISRAYSTGDSMPTTTYDLEAAWGAVHDATPAG